MKINQILQLNKEIKINLKGWLISNRGNNKIRFLIINDGSDFRDIQIVLKSSLALEFNDVRIGSALEVEGELKITPNSQQTVEIVASKVVLLKNTSEDFPLQKQNMSREILREIPHLRHKSKLFKAIMRIRSTLFLEIHNFFNEKNFLNLTSPIITSNDGEGAGETFVVDSEKGDFFKTKATLAVTGQLQAESYANGFGDVYVFGPTFRAEKSNTKRHAAEFWMLEAEIAFKNKDEVINLIDEMLKTIIKNTIKKHRYELVFLETFTSKKIIKKLEDFIDKKIQQMTYKDALVKLEKVKDKFENQDIKFGIDFNIEHEKYLSDEIVRGPVAIVDYPKDIKAFYMRENNDGKTVAAFDVLFPEIGELIGGSERECNFNKLKKRISDMNIDEEEMQWYLDLRKFGHYQSVGFGLGFERLIMYVTGIENIRDVIPYPRTNGNLKM